MDLNRLNVQAKQIVAKYEQPNAAVLPLLHLAQDQLGHVTPEAEQWVSKWTEVPVVHVREVVTFYTMFRQKPAGKKHIRYCTGTSCALAGGEKLLEHLKKNLKPDTTLEEAECLCACEKAPMMQVNDEYIGNLTEKMIEETIRKNK